MKTLSHIAFFLACFSLSPAFSQQIVNPFSPKMMPPVEFQGNSTKRLKSESDFKWLLPDELIYSPDSSVYFYDTINRKIEQINFQLENGEWLMKTRNRYLEFDSLGNVVKSLSERSEDNGLTWIYYLRDSVAFDTAGHVIFTQTQFWIPFSNQWGAPSISRYTYDQYGNNVLTSLSSFHILNDYVYSPEGYILEKEVFYSSDMINWDPGFRQVTTYDSIHPALPATDVLWEYDEDGQYWAWSGNYSYTYDAAGRMILSTAFDSLPDSDFECYTVSKNLVEYDADGHPLRLEFYEACPAHVMDWQLVYAIDWTYDAEGAPLQSVEHGYYGSDSSLYIHRYYYETLSRTDQPEISQKDLRIFPNPASDRITLQLEGDFEPVRIRITDVQGNSREFQWGDHESLVELPVNDLPSGLYFVSIFGEKEIRAGKFTICR